ncbi:MAG: hypothetical protein R3F59_03510 [Myxococcota bacterium]
MRPDRARGQGYVVEARPTSGLRWPLQAFTADKVVLAGGVLGTVDLLAAMKGVPDGLPELSDQVGRDVRTNSEALFGVTAPGTDLTRGVAIGSILHTDERSHLEPVRYPGSGLYRIMVLPHAPGTRCRRGCCQRALRAVAPAAGARCGRSSATSKSSAIPALHAQRRGQAVARARRLRARQPGGGRRGAVGVDPRGHRPWPRRFADKMGGFVQSLFTETLLGSPTTAHILAARSSGARPPRA